MGKAAKTRRAEHRKSEKRARKKRQQDLYESYKKAGSNKKKKGDTSAVRGVSTVRHAALNCGNVGCKRCFPDLAMPRMNAPHARLAPTVKRKAKSAPMGAAFLGLNPPTGFLKFGDGLAPEEDAFFANLNQ